MPRRYYRYDSSSVSADSYRIAPPLPYGRRSKVHHTKTETRVDRPKRRDDISADSVRIAPKVKPWRSRRDHNRGHRSKQGEELPRAHSKPKTKKKSKHSRHKRPADSESSEYEPPADIKQNPFFKDIWEEPKPPKVRKPPQPNVEPIPPPPKTTKATINQPKNNNKKIAGQTATTKPTAKPPPPGPLNSGIPGLHGQTMQPQPFYGQAPPPPGHQPPPPAPNGGHYNTKIVAPHQQQPMHNTTYPAPSYNVAPPRLTLDQKLAQQRARYERLYKQYDPTAQYLVSGPPQGPGQPLRQLPLPSQYQSNVNPYEVREAPVNFYEAQEAEKARARKGEEAQRKLAAVTAKHKEATERVAALKAKGPDYSKDHSSSKQKDEAPTRSNEDYIAKLERGHREAVAEAERAGVKFPKHVSINDERTFHEPVEYSTSDTGLSDNPSPQRGHAERERGRRESARQDHHYGRQSPREYEGGSLSHHRSHSTGARRHERDGRSHGGSRSHHARESEERYNRHRRSSSHDPGNSHPRNVRPRTPRRGVHQRPHMRDQL